ncbi:MAG: nucleoside hydrolase [Ardenticatenaceae bacterium]|nr:nucleoside hydrolase [Ardenticatenaceae bacterium]
MKRVIIDTDPGIDDTAAILLALASPELSVEAVTTVYGNGHVEDCTRNALTILEAAGRGDIPVYQGAGKPLTRPPNIGSHVHGRDALGDANVPPPHGTPQPEHAVWALIELVMSNPGQITLLALAPLTNVALALSIEPRMATALKELILMGGAVLTWGNASEVASANLYNDPEAAAVVYQSGVPIVQVGLDVCRKVQIRADQLARIQQGTGPTIDLLTRITPQIVRFYTSQGNLPGGGVQYNDVPAIAYAIDPGLFDIHDYFVRISTHDELTKGQTVADVGNRWGQVPNARVLMGVDSDRLTEIFTSRILGYEQPATAAT